MKKLRIIKIGGHIIDDKNRLLAFLKKFQKLEGPKILVHGGGGSATALAETLGVKQTMIEGRRITDSKTLEIAVMVYAGLINKTIIAQLQMLNCNAIGLTGADANLIKSKKRDNTLIDYGFVGDILSDGVNVPVIVELLEKNTIPVLSPITHDGEGNLLNTNADTLASKMAVAMAKHYSVTLTYCFEKKGVLRETNKEASYLHEITMANYIQLKNQHIISDGMIPKLDNAFDALANGVSSIEIGQAENLNPNSNLAFIGTTLKL